jgi:pimeloyl-ACP methyl ester carboxylesterase
VTTPPLHVRPPSAAGTAGTQPALQIANQLGTVFARLDCKPRWRERLSELATPALVVNGRRDPFFPIGNGEALAREIPRARLLVLEQGRHGY